VSDELRRVETVKATYLGGRGFTIMTDWDRHERSPATAPRADDGAAVPEAGRAVERPALGA
jgi:hypothetical protein